MKEPLVQLETCKACGMPYGSPEPESAHSRSYCQRCANLPQNVMAILEMHELQLHRKAQEAEAGSATTVRVPGEPAHNA